MFLSTPEIVWHSKEPVFSVDFHHSGDQWRLATSGADHTIKIWKLLQDGDSSSSVQFYANLDRHTKAVNVVRFSPNGNYLASGSDDCTICLWQLKTDTTTSDVAMETEDTDVNKETWTIYKILRGHIEDVYDLCWSSDCCYIVSGSVDNTAIVWNVNTGDKVAILNESHHYIQGVAWDPSDCCLATLSTDRSLRIYRLQNDKYRCVHNISKMSEMEHVKANTRMFHDETISSFFRRLTFSPDGNLLVAPGGRVDINEQSLNVTWIFTKSSLPKPVLYLPCGSRSSIIVRFCPLLYELCDSTTNSTISSCSNTNGDTSTAATTNNLFDLPYRMVYAVLTLEEVILYDTQHTTPIGYITDIHYASLTDATWSDSGHHLIVSSSDGYCSIISFEQNELGTPLSSDKTSSLYHSPNKSQISPPKSATPTSAHTPSCSQPTRRITPIRVDTPTRKIATPSFVTTPTSKNSGITCNVTTPITKEDTPLIGFTTPTSSVAMPINNVTTPTSDKKPRRVNFITLA